MTKGDVRSLVRIASLLTVMTFVGCHDQTRSLKDWFVTPDQQAQRLFDEQKFEQASKTFHDPMWQGISLYRAGEFEKAAATFGQIDSAEGLFNRGNALLMHGKYDDAIESYNNALEFRHDWQEARENRGLAVARGQAIKNAGQHQEEAAGIKADAIVIGKKRISPNSQTGEMEKAIDTSDPAFRQMWLRRVQTTPQDFLRAKFAYQSSVAEQQNKP